MFNKKSAKENLNFNRINNLLSSLFIVNKKEYISKLIKNNEIVIYNNNIYLSNKFLIDRKLIINNKNFIKLKEEKNNINNINDIKKFIF